MAVTDDTYPTNSRNPDATNVLMNQPVANSNSDILEISPPVFNESAKSGGAGNSSASADIQRHRSSPLTCSAKSLITPIKDDRGRHETFMIDNLMNNNVGTGNSDNLERSEKVKEPELEEKVEIGEQKRRRPRRKRKMEDQVEECADDVSVEIVNKHGVVVDLCALETYDDPYGAELKRRTEGLETEEELLDFLGGLEGKWCSRRMKWRIVDADAFGDVYPVGWKLIIGVKLNGGRPSPYCRRYISPTGEELLSCKDASSYLRSYFGPNVGSLLKDSGVELPKESDASTDQAADKKPKDSSSNQDMSQQTKLDTSGPSEYENGMPSSELDNLLDVEILEIFECRQCNVSFHERKPYLEHLASYHLKTIKQWPTFPSNSSEGMIIRDGRYECGSSHGVDKEKQQDNDHVEVHGRNTGHVLGMEEAARDSTSPTVNRAAIKHIMTICLWCGEEFCHKVVETQLDPDCVGFMCPIWLVLATKLTA